MRLFIYQVLVYCIIITHELRFVAQVNMPLDKIGLAIGAGGKNVKEVTAKTGVRFVF